MTPLKRSCTCRHRSRLPLMVTATVVGRRQASLMKQMLALHCPWSCECTSTRAWPPRGAQGPKWCCKLVRKQRDSERRHPASLGKEQWP